jgi:hypothetical protein
MITMKNFSVANYSETCDSIHEVNDLDLALHLFHEGVEAEIFDKVELKDNQTGEILAHSGKGEDEVHLSPRVVIYMMNDIASILGGNTPIPQGDAPTSQPEDSDPTPSAENMMDELFKAILGGLGD